MPLTDYQADLVRLLSENRTFDSYLAGDAAILIEPNTTRFSHDLWLRPRSGAQGRRRHQGRVGARFSLAVHADSA
jgi:hypothetical protein